MLNFLNQNNNEDRSYEHAEIVRLLQQINNQCFYTTERIKSVEEFCMATFPSDIKSIQQRKRENLAKIYSRHLIEKEGLSPKDALIRARFEVTKFDNDEIVRELNREVGEKEEKDAESEYYNSALVDKDIKEFWTIGNLHTNEREISPYDLFAPVYSLIKGSQYKEDDNVSVDWDADKDYYTFIKNRAIIHNLEKLKILTKVTDNKNPRNIGNQNYKLNISDINIIGEIIYKGPRHHSDSYFDEKLEENRLETIFRSE